MGDSVCLKRGEPWPFSKASGRRVKCPWGRWTLRREALSSGHDIRAGPPVGHCQGQHPALWTADSAPGPARDEVRDRVRRGSEREESLLCQMLAPSAGATTLAGFSPACWDCGLRTLPTDPSPQSLGAYSWTEVLGGSTTKMRPYGGSDVSSPRRWCPRISLWLTLACGAAHRALGVERALARYGFCGCIPSI